MLRGLFCLSLFLFAAAGAPHSAPTPQGPAAAAFVALDVFVDTGSQTLAAWQCELTFVTAKLVGIEGGEPKAFADAPLYDPEALQGGRVILAALADGQQLPTGRVRVARVHVVESGGKLGDYTLGGITAVSQFGERIRVDVEVRRHGDQG